MSQTWSIFIVDAIFSLILYGSCTNCSRFTWRRPAESVHLINFWNFWFIFIHFRVQGGGYSEIRNFALAQFVNGFLMASCTCWRAVRFDYWLIHISKYLHLNRESGSGKTSHSKMQSFFRSTFHVQSQVFQPTV